MVEHAPEKRWQKLTQSLGYKIIHKWQLGNHYAVSYREYDVRTRSAVTLVRVQLKALMVAMAKFEIRN